MTGLYIAVVALLVIATVFVLLSVRTQVQPRAVPAGNLKTAGATAVKTICPYCSVGCGISLFVRDGQLVTATGDPEHPINEGSLCPKGASITNLRQIPNDQGESLPNPRRLTTVLYRAPGASAWQERSWEWAIREIARRYKFTRDTTFQKTDDRGVTVNRTFNIGHIGSAALDNEENYLIQKWHRACGVVRIEHHARL